MRGASAGSGGSISATSMIGAPGFAPAAAAQRRAVCSGSARSQRDQSGAALRRLDVRVREVHDDRRQRAAARVEAHHRGVIAQRRDLLAAPQHEQLVGERVCRPSTGRPRIPREPLADHLARLHLAARAELEPQPLVGRREVGVVGVAHAAHAHVGPVARRLGAVAGREVLGEQRRRPSMAPAVVTSPARQRSPRGMVPPRSRRQPPSRRLAGTRAACRAPLGAHGALRPRHAAPARRGASPASVHRSPRHARRAART